ncbi:serine/threonine-protein kinase nekl-2-like [Acropora muricata]|uniref:serine/threonine-protein kinase nekl-2-like n=1 Tax=Acropora muricata TaxID=159855 RepID=UPI0034E3E692
MGDLFPCDHVEEEILALTLAKKDKVKYIVDYYGTKLEDGTAYICMQFMNRGTLEKHIERQRGKLPVGAWPIIDEGTCFDFVGDILKGVEFLNSKGLVHGDIKGDNVLLDESFTHVKLADFGLSRKIEDHVGTPDVLRTGRLLIEMLNGGRSSILDHFLFGDADYQRLKSVFQKHFPPQASKETTDLLNIIFASELLLGAADILRISRQLQPLQR